VLSAWRTPTTASANIGPSLHTLQPRTKRSWCRCCFSGPTSRVAGPLNPAEQHPQPAQEENDRGDTITGKLPEGEAFPEQQPKVGHRVAEGRRGKDWRGENCQTAQTAPDEPADKAANAAEAAKEDRRTNPLTALAMPAIREKSGLRTSQIRQKTRRPSLSDFRAFSYASDCSP